MELWRGGVVERWRGGEGGDEVVKNAWLLVYKPDVFALHQF